jgi:phosphoadenosine phosphosulfate reductase
MTISSERKQGEQSPPPKRDLRALAAQAAVDLADASAEEIIAWAAREFGDRFAVASSMQDGVLPHLTSQVAPGTDVLFLDTGYHFAETLGTRDAMAASYPLEIINLTSRQTVAEQDAEFGPRLHDRNPDLCCALRKTAPLDAALVGYDAWATGMRRADSPTRAGTPVVSYDEKRNAIKIAPLAAWSDDDVDAYIEKHGVLVNPLRYDGYPSIGCLPCTRRVLEGEDARAGRWSGTSKTECGINT